MEELTGNTLKALAVVAGMTWVLTFAIRSMFKKHQPPPNLIALIIGLALTFANWNLGLIPLDVPNHGNVWAWIAVAAYGLVAVFTANKAHDIGENWKTLIKRTKRGEVVE